MWLCCACVSLSPCSLGPQNFKSVVRRLEHTTLLLTALCFPPQPDLLMVWATAGYSPFVAPEATSVQMAVLGHNDSGELRSWELPPCCGETHVRIVLTSHSYVKDHVVSHKCPKPFDRQG